MEAGRPGCGLFAGAGRLTPAVFLWLRDIRWSRSPHRSSRCCYRLMTWTHTCKTTKTLQWQTSPSLCNSHRFCQCKNISKVNTCISTYISYSIILARTGGVIAQHSVNEHNTYPPLTPMNCRFFFVEGDPGSPSALRFIMDLREDCGDEAGKENSDHTYSRNVMWQKS